jgi:hypothetical protein
MTARFRLATAASAFAGAALLLAAPAAAQCWTGGTAGQGVPRESLLVTNRAPFAVNVMAGPAGGAQRVLGQVPAGTTMSFASVLPPGRNQTTLWISPEDQDKYKLPTARQTGAITIANRRALTCRRAAQLEVTQAVFAGVPRGPNTNVARRTDLSRLAPAAGPRRPAAKAPQNTTAKRRTDLSRLAPGAGPARGNAPDPALRGRQPGAPTGSAGVVRY